MLRSNYKSVVVTFLSYSCCRNTVFVFNYLHIDLDAFSQEWCMFDNLIQLYVRYKNLVKGFGINMGLSIVNLHFAF